ncbi:MAG: TetR/AcrR family transcriptional regulator [Actinobacteria bacterium]|nr:TetR/AcrR family transcriptional regulator [Actinomycetota bacterium]
MSTPEDPGSRAPSTDARAVRTRARLIEAYLEITATGHVPKVSTVIRAARVNRSSFYAHFDDMDDMTLRVLDDALDDLSRTQAELSARAQRPTGLTALAAGGAYLDALGANRSSLRSAITANRAQAQARIGDTIERNMLEFLAITPGWDSGSARSQLTASWVAHGWAGVVCAWIAGEIEIDRDSLLQELVALNPRVPAQD